MQAPQQGVEFVLGDLATGDGIDAAVRDVETIVHLAGTDKGDEVKAHVLVRAASRAGVRHVVNISVVGADRVPVISRIDKAMFAYFASQQAAEDAIEQSGIPWTNLRATQFHEFVFTVVKQLARSPITLIPAGLKFQPVDSSVVGDRIVELALAGPAGRVADIAGPRVHPLADLVRSYLRARGRRAAIVAVPVPGRAAAAFRAGANLAPESAAGGRTWEEYLQAMC
jgi:uncharacterized protein YbjT (DUF2867 family)